VLVRRTFFELAVLEQDGIVGEPEIVCSHHGFL